MLHQLIAMNKINYVIIKVCYEVMKLYVSMSLSDLTNIPNDYLIRHTIETAPLDNPGSRKWSNLVSMNQGRLFPLVKEVLGEKQVPRFIETLSAAKEEWTCHQV